MLRRLVPRTFQARLALAFVGVVALTLALVSVFIVNRLDDYFTQQQAAELQARATLVAKFVDGAASYAVGEGQPVIVGDRLSPRAALALSL